jgi:hypothetical protein
MIAYEDRKIAHLVKNHPLAKSRSDASWGLFLGWLRYYGQMHGSPVVAVSPRYTTQDGSGCGERVQKTLSMRTHLCPACGLVLDRDWNAAPPHPAFLPWNTWPSSVPPGRRKRVALGRGATLLDRRPLASVGSRASSSRLDEGSIPRRKLRGVSN